MRNSSKLFILLPSTLRGMLLTIRRLRHLASSGSAPVVAEDSSRSTRPFRGRLRHLYTVRIRSSDDDTIPVSEVPQVPQLEKVAV